MIAIGLHKPSETKPQWRPRRPELSILTGSASINGWSLPEIGTRLQSDDSADRLEAEFLVFHCASQLVDCLDDIDVIGLPRRFFELVLLGAALADSSATAGRLERLAASAEAPRYREFGRDRCFDPVQRDIRGRIRVQGTPIARLFRRVEAGKPKSKEARALLLDHKLEILGAMDCAELATLPAVARRLLGLSGQR